MRFSRRSQHLTRSSLHRLPGSATAYLSIAQRSRASRAAKKTVQGLSDRLLSTSISPKSSTAEGKLLPISSPLIERANSPFVAVGREDRTEPRRLCRLPPPRVIAAFPYKIHTVLTDNGIQFTFARRTAVQPTARHQAGVGMTASMFRAHSFALACAQNGIQHRLTKVKHPVDQRAGRTHEPYDQRRDGEALPL